MTYKGFSVFPKEFLFLDGFTKNITHDKVILGQPYQNQMFLYNKSDRFTFDVKIQFNNYDEYYQIRQWFKSLKGRFTKFWFPSISNEIILLDDIKQSYSSIRVVDSSFKTLFSYKRMFLYFIEFDFITKVIDVVQYGYKNEYKNKVADLILEDSLPFSMKMSNCNFINFVFLGSLSSDDITFNFIDLVRGEVKFSFTEITQSHYEQLNL